jgi:peptide subunit release factor 1 (eRF1)
MVTGMDAATFAKLYAVDGPFVTIYLATPSDIEDAAAQLEVRWNNVTRELAAAGVDAATISALGASRGAHDRGNARVLVAAHGKIHLAVSLPHAPARDEIVTSALPRLVPLLDAMTQQVPHVVVLADRTGADVLTYTLGPDPVEAVSVTTDRFPSRKVRAGGWASLRYEHDVEETWDQSARDVAALVDRVARDIDARVVIASGDERALQLLGQHVPTHLVDRFVTVGGGGRARDGSDDVIASEVARVLSDTVAADTVELLEDFSEQRGREERSADGINATVEALRRGQVETLILTPARDSTLTAFFGPDPVHLAVSAHELLDLGVEQPWEAPLEEIVVRAALGTGANVRFVAGGTGQAPADGVGALLRYAD